MSIKKYTNGSWTPACRKYGTETDSITTLPATIIGDGTPISSYTIKGNMEQSGTPTPSSPIYPSECGERTENEAWTGWAQDYVSRIGSSREAWIATISERNCLAYMASAGYPDYDNKYLFKLDWETATPYTISFEGMRPSTATAANVISVYYADGTRDDIQSVNDGTFHRYTITTNPNKIVKYIAPFFSSGSFNIDIDTFIVIEGTTAPTSYIPYGYKLPLTLGSTTTDIYLGEVQSTRRIKKLVLTGEENCYTYVYAGANGVEVSNVLDANYTRNNGFCSHYPVYPKNISGVNSLWIGANSKSLLFVGILDILGISSASDFKSYLAAQYAAGTPVTVWYVLAEPTTGIVNEPLRKIGDYADSVSGTGLATSGTAQEFDVDTTMKPSEVDMTYHGWHEHKDTKYST